uniref:Uncharacterized protein n=1 Tax=Rhizophora mucronata TaxID=61149 RepID=A0A2P2QRV6_RHIMU
MQSIKRLNAFPNSVNQWQVHQHRKI